MKLTACEWPLGAPPPYIARCPKALVLLFRTKNAPRAGVACWPKGSQWPAHLNLKVHASSSPDEVRPSEVDDSPLYFQAHCYGCGVAVQIVDPDIPGFVSPDVVALRCRHRQLHMLLCTRCQGLSNGAMIPGVEDFAQRAQAIINTDQKNSSGPPPLTMKALATPEQLREELRAVRSARALIVLLIDILDASGSVLSRVRELVGGNPIIAVGTKADLLPRGTTVGQVAEWMQDTLTFKRISADSVHLISSRTGEGVSEAAAAIRKARLGRDVYVMGAANVGKSAFIRAFVKEMADIGSRQFDPGAIQRARHLPVESAMPGTTLKCIPLDVFSGGGVLYDTPGLHLHHRVPHLLTPEENKALHPRKKLSAWVSPALADAIAVNSNPSADGPLATYFWGGIAKIEVLSGPLDTRLVFYGPPAMRVAVERPCLPEPVVQDSTMFGSKSVEARGGLREARTVSLNVGREGMQALGDIAVSGVPGWIAVHAGAPYSGRSTSPGTQVITVRVYAPVGVEVYVRPSLPVIPPRVFP